MQREDLGSHATIVGARKPMPGLRLGHDPINGQDGFATRSPRCILHRNTPDQVDALEAGRRSAGLSLRLASPVVAEALAMPADDSLGLDDSVGRGVSEGGRGSWEGQG